MSTLRKTALIVLLLLTLAGGACWLYADRILNDLLRPQLESTTAKALAAEVRIGSLLWSAEGLDLNKLSIRIPGSGQLTVAKIATEFTLASLWQRRLTAVHILRPQLEFTPPTSKTESPQAQQTPPGQRPLPEKLPLAIDSLTVSAGGLILAQAERSIQLHAIDFSGSLQEQAPFQLTALLGTDDRHPLAVAGSITLNDRPALTLDRLEYQQRPVLSQPLSLLFSGSGLQQGGGTLNIAHFDQQQLDDILGALEINNPLPEDVHFAVTDLEITLKQTDTTSQIGLKVAAGEVAQGAYRLPFAVKDLQLSRTDGVWLAHGEVTTLAETSIGLSARLAEDGLSGQAQVLIPHPDQLKTGLFGGDPLGIAGRLQLVVDARDRADGLDLTLAISAEANPETSAYLVNLANLSGEVRLTRAADKEQLSIDLRQAGKPLFKAAGDLRTLDFSLAPINLAQLRTVLAPRFLPQALGPLEGLRASGRLTGHSDNRWQARVDLQLDTAGLSGLTLDDVKVRADLDLAAGQLTTRNLGVSGKIHKGEELSATLSGQLSAALSARQVDVTLQKFTLADINYMATDGQSGLASGRIEVNGSMKRAAPDAPLNLDLTGTAGVAEALAGAFYADFSALKSTFSLAGELSSDGQTLTAHAFALEVSRLGKLTGSGDLSTTELRLNTQLELPDLARAYGSTIAPMLVGIWPAADGLTIEGGLTIAADLHWLPPGWRVVGELRPQRLDAFWERHGLEVADGSGLLPFHLVQGEPPVTAEATGEKRGEISFATLSIGLASLQQGSLTLAAEPNQLTLRSPLRLLLAGGRVAIDELTLGWDAQGPQGSIRLNIAEVDLEPLTAELGLPTMRGTLTGDLGSISYVGHQLSTSGTMTLDVFGGRFLLGDMRFSNPFSRYPVFHADIDFSGIDLQQATRTFEFGEMNGILDGQIHGLRLFGATPSAFHARIATRPKGKRNISVKALNNLSVISQGGTSAILSRGIYQFIDFYRYQKIGFECELENDTFTLIGTARSDSKRYLVSGGLLPPRIDITTTTPTISFKEMVKRLSRIDRTGN